MADAKVPFGFTREEVRKLAMDAKVEVARAIMAMRGDEPLEKKHRKQVAADEAVTTLGNAALEMVKRIEELEGRLAEEQRDFPP